MNYLRLLLISFISLFAPFMADCQANASLNILTQNSGLVNIGGTIFIEVSVGNTGPNSSIGVYKVKTQISVPSSIVSIPTTGHSLPAGWTITSNNGSTINLSNGTDMIPVNEIRTILIAVQGNATGGPLTVAGGLSFSNGNPPGTAPGTLAGDNTADNISTSSIQVANAVPLTITNFSASIVSCRTVLNWTTETEINSDHFEIERTTEGRNNWTVIATAAAAGNSSQFKKYSFTDQLADMESGSRILYRLKLVDQNGSFTYSKLIPVFINCNNPVIQVYPNPARNNSQLYIHLKDFTGSATALIMASDGRLVSSQNIATGTSTLNIAGIAPGLYILHFISPNMNPKKIVLQIQH